MSLNHVDGRLGLAELCAVSPVEARQRLIDDRDFRLETHGNARSGASGHTAINYANTGR